MYGWVPKSIKEKILVESCDSDMLDQAHFADYEGSTCERCECFFKLKDRVLVLTCSHIYHKECLKDLLDNESNECVHCKKLIMGIKTPWLIDLDS